MNKLLTKIVGVVLGTTMAVGVGVGVAVNSDRKDIDSQVNAAALSGDGYSKITAVSSLSTGDKVVIYNDSLGYGVTGMNTSTNKDVTATAVEANWIQFDVTRSSTGFTLNTGTSYIYAVEKTIKFDTSTNASDLTVTSEGVLATNTSTQYLLQANGDYWRPYKSNANYSDFFVYKVNSGGGSSGTTTNITRVISGPSDMAKVVGDAAFDIANDISIEDESPATGYTVSSSNTNAVTVSGTTLTPVAKGNSTITIAKETNTVVDGDNTTNYIYTSHTFTIAVTNPPIELPDMPNGDYVKITTTSDLVDGYYLLVYEGGNKVFDGSLSSLDAQAGYSVTISESTIETSATIDAKALYISALEGTNQFSIVANVDETNPVYIGRNATSNGLETSDEVLSNTITISSGLASILGAGGRKLNYYSNNSNFRYYASSNDTLVSLYKKTSTAPVVDVYSENINVSKDSTTIPLGDSETITATIDQAATVRTITWESSNDKVHVTDGVISVDADATVASTATITAKVPASAAENDFLTATCTVTVGPAKLTGLTRNGYNAYYIGQKISDYQGGSITASWTAGDPTAIALDNANLAITLGGDAATKDTVLEASDNGKQIRFTYTDPNYGEVSKYAATSISVGSFFELDDLSANFTDSKNYILVDDTDSTLNFGYTSWGGQAALSVASSNEDVLEAAIGTHTFSNRKGTGTITILAYAQGTAVITLSATVNEQVLTKSYTVLVRSSDPETSGGETSYVLISSLSDLTSDDYVIGAYNSSYVGMGQTLASGKYSSSNLTVSNGTITSSVTGLPYTLTVSGTGNSRTITIYNPSTSKYVKYNSSTNLAEDSNSYSFTVTLVDNYFRFTSQTNGRGLCYGTSQTKFGGYVPGASGYNDLCLFKKTVSGQTADDVTIVQTFVNSYMHTEILDSNREDTGACRGENGYYAVAKSHLQSDLNATQRLIFRDTFNVYYQRMVDWGIACSENFAINNSGEIVTSAINSRPINNINGVNSNNVAIIIVISSVVVMASIGGYFLLRKRKEQ